MDSVPISRALSFPSLSSTRASSLCPGTGLNEPLIYLQPSGIWSVDANDGFLWYASVAIGSVSDLHSQGLGALSKPHLTGSLVRIIFNLGYKCQSIILLKTERAFVCKAEDSKILEPKRR